MGCTRQAVARVLAGFLGLFSLANLAGGLWREGFDANLWWVDPGRLGPAPLLAGTLALLLFAFRPLRSRTGRLVCAAAVAPLLLISLGNAWGFYRLLSEGRIRSGAPVPLSLLVAGALGLVLLGVLGARPEGGACTPRTRLWAGMAAGLCVLGFPLAHMVCFGKTDYRRPADAAVVPGARVYADGTLSQALADRVRTACALWRAGTVRSLVFSGGPGDGAISEPEGMRRFALGEGVSAEAILLDQGGLSSRATVEGTVLVVSHFYHLPRLKMGYRRAGREVFTVPAEESRTLTATPYYMLREAAGWWVYYLWPPTRSTA